MKDGFWRQLICVARRDKNGDADCGLILSGSVHQSVSDSTVTSQMSPVDAPSIIWGCHTLDHLPVVSFASPSAVAAHQREHQLNQMYSFCRSPGLEHTLIFEHSYSLYNSPKGLLTYSFDTTIGPIHCFFWFIILRGVPPILILECPLKLKDAFFLSGILTSNSPETVAQLTLCKHFLWKKKNAPLVLNWETIWDPHAQAESS